MTKVGIKQFFKQVRQDAGKVTWSSRKEVFSSTSVVVIMIFISSLFFLLVDGVVFNFIQFILGL